MKRSTARGRVFFFLSHTVVIDIVGVFFLFFAPDAIIIIIHVIIRNVRSRHRAHCISSADTSHVCLCNVFTFSHAPPHTYRWLSACVRLRSVPLLRRRLKLKIYYRKIRTNILLVFFYFLHM